MPLKLMHITNDPGAAYDAARAGVDRIFIDTERLGKLERQHGTGSFLSTHTLDDVKPVKRAVAPLGAQVLVRVNPLHRGTGEEIDRAVTSGADILMLPMFCSAGEVREFVSLVGGRAKVCLLLETKQALEQADRIFEVPGVDEVHIGLNDLHLALKLGFMFELLSGGTVEALAEKLGRRGIFWGFGGISRMGTGDLPAELILSEHVRLGSGMVILSRAFSGADDSTRAMPFEWLRTELSKLREQEREYRACPAAVLAGNRAELVKKVDAIVNARMAAAYGG